MGTAPGVPTSRMTTAASPSSRLMARIPCVTRRSRGSVGRMFCRSTSRERNGPIRRAIVDDQNRGSGVGLVEDAGQSFGEKISPIAGGD